METAMLESQFNETTALQACIFIKKELQHRCFPVIIAKILKVTILKNICPMAATVYSEVC